MVSLKRMREEMTSSLRWGGGVIEGFYGTPWSRAERLQLFDWMVRSGLTTYFHAPKDDPHHRAIWREPLPAAAAAALAELINDCRSRGISLVFAIHPGLDIHYGSAGDLRLLTARFEQVVAMGGSDFAVLFDDIPGVLTPEDAAVFGSLAEAQASVANQLQAWLAERLPEGRLLLCPTAYCTRMANAHLGGEGYLAELGRQLDSGVDVLWTGPEIISREIGQEHLESIGRVLRRPPVIWDNLFADDYDGDRFFIGPYAGRPSEIAPLVRGLLLNPNNELPLNFVACHTLGQFLANTASAEPATWQPRVSYQAALNDWLPSFALLSDTASVTLEDLRLLADCFYLPHEHGDLAVVLSFMPSAAGCGHCGKNSRCCGSGWPISSGQRAASLSCRMTTICLARFVADLWRTSGVSCRFRTRWADCLRLATRGIGFRCCGRHGQTIWLPAIESA
jgi:hypothetical protein